MKAYKVGITDTAKRDLRAIIRYIRTKLRAPQAARELYLTIRGEIQELDHMPERYPLYPEEPWCGRGIRKLNVKKYCVFYRVDHEQAAVEVSRIMYAGRDLSACLRDTDWDDL